MRTVVVSALGREVSALGFGCGQLGSWISEARGRRALDHAFERGVTWYDVAPFYGDGEAENVLGRFALGRRDRIVICTKIGGVRPRTSALRRILRPLARAALTVVPILSGSEGPAIRGPSRSETMNTERLEASVVESLRRLRRDCVDVLALHDPSPDDCRDPALIATLTRLVEKGYVRSLGIDGSAAAIEAAIGASAPFPIVQLRHSMFEPTSERLHLGPEEKSSRFFVHYGVFGMAVLERLARLLVGDGGRLASLASQLGYGPPFMTSELLLDHAFASNPKGVVLVSMFDSSHIDRNCVRAARPPRTDVIPFVEKFILTASSKAG
jgi:aryl-alcohol dehydrogenase-like predicted oxidoreductase